MTLDSRHDVAACSRMLVAADILNYSGHVSARVDGQDAFLIQRTHDPRALLEPDRLLVVDFDGNVLEGDGTPPSELFIHAEIYRARPDAGSVAHFHHDPTTVFTVVPDRPLLPVKNHASRWAGGIPVHPDSSHIDLPQQGRQIVQTLAGGDAVLLRAHGQVLLAESVAGVFVDALHLVENTNVLLQGLQLGPVQGLTEAEQAEFLATFNRAGHVEKLWRYYYDVNRAAGVIPQAWSSPAVAA